MRGGLQLLAQKDQSASIVNASIPAQLLFVVPAQTQLLVSVGNRVLRGQPLTQGNSTILHSSVSGYVSHIGTDGNSSGHSSHPGAGREPVNSEFISSLDPGLRRGDSHKPTSSSAVTTIVIDNDGHDDSHPSMQPVAQFDSLSPQSSRDRIALAGIEGLGGAAFSTATKLHAAAAQQVKLLIVNGAECEPFISCDDALMRTHADDVVLGTLALMHASGAAEAVIAIEANKPQAIAAVAQALAAHSHIRLHTLANFYPTGGERQLVKLITSKEVPSGKIPPDIGVLCQNVGTAAAIARLIKTGHPLIERLVTVTGSGVKQPQTLLARFGTPIASLIQDCGGYTENVERLIMGGSMMGLALDSDETAVTAATNCIIAATSQDLKPRGAEMPCIRCGECAQVCPAALLPQQLLRYARLQDRAALSELGLQDCIECGCCDYVCPSQIPLTSLFAAAKTSP